MQQINQDHLKRFDCLNNAFLGLLYQPSARRRCKQRLAESELLLLNIWSFHFSGSRRERELLQKNGEILNIFSSFEMRREIQKYFL